VTASLQKPTPSPMMLAHRAQRLIARLAVDGPTDFGDLDHHEARTVGAGVACGLVETRGAVVRLSRLGALYVTPPGEPAWVCG
jgi:hypothetical protein